MDEKTADRNGSKDWREEWKDMPEFVQDKQRPFATCTIRFRTKEDLEDFARLIGQKMTEKTKSIWHPKLVRGVNAHKRWRDES